MIAYRIFLASGGENAKKDYQVISCLTVFTLKTLVFKFKSFIHEVLLKYPSDDCYICVKANHVHFVMYLVCTLFTVIVFRSLYVLCIVLCLVSTVLDSAHCVHDIWNSMFQISCLFMPDMGSRIYNRPHMWSLVFWHSITG